MGKLVLKEEMNETKLYLKVMLSLDREKQDFYDIIIEAKDDGEPQLRTRLNVKVHVKDVNDNPPMFIEENYYLSFEKQPVFGKELLRITATDEDLDENGKV